jgi:hypothetical protein
MHILEGEDMKVLRITALISLLTFLGGSYCMESEKRVGEGAAVSLANFIAANDEMLSNLPPEFQDMVLKKLSKGFLFDRLIQMYIITKEIPFDIVQAISRYDAKRFIAQGTKDKKLLKKVQGLRNIATEKFLKGASETFNLDLGNLKEELNKLSDEEKSELIKTLWKRILQQEEKIIAPRRRLQSEPQIYAVPRPGGLLFRPAKWK